MHSIFVSDLHLTPDRPRATELFFDFTAGAAAQAASRSTSSATCSNTGSATTTWTTRSTRRSPTRCDALSGKGVALYFMHGNRDFLVGRGLRRGAAARS